MQATSNLNVSYQTTPRVDTAAALKIYTVAWLQKNPRSLPPTESLRQVLKVHRFTWKTMIRRSVSECQMQRQGSLEPLAPAKKRPAAAGLAAIRASQAFAEGVKCGVVIPSSQATRHPTDATLHPPNSSEPTTEGDAPGEDLKNTVIEGLDVAEATSQVHNTALCKMHIHVQQQYMLDLLQIYIRLIYVCCYFI